MRRLVIINGPPASGKTTILEGLSRQLGWKIVTKDSIKESLLIKLGVQSVKENRALSQKSFEILFEELSGLMSDGKDLLVEGNFRGKKHQETLDELVRKNRYGALQIFCHATDAVLVRRYAQRVSSTDRHPGHEQVLDIQSVRESGQCDALNIKGTLVDFDNTKGQAFDSRRVTDWALNKQ